MLVLVFVGCRGLSSCGHDERRDRRRAFEEWTRQQPEWSQHDGRHTAPQPLTADSLYRGAEPLRGEALEDAMLLCDVQASRAKRWDAFGGAPDLAAVLKVGDGFERMATLGRGGYGVVLSWPRVTLHRGDVIKLTVLDLDLSRHDEAGRASMPWDGAFPLTFSEGAVEVECRALKRQVWEAELPRRIAFCEKALENFETSIRPDLGPRGWTYPETEEREVQRYIEDVAAYVSWADERATSLINRYDVVKARQLEAVRQAVDEKRRALPEVGTPVAVSSKIALSVVDVGCDANRKAALRGLSAVPGDYRSRPCYVVLKAVNTSQEEMRFHLAAFEPLSELSMLGPDGRPLRLEPFGAVLMDGSAVGAHGLQGGESPEVVLRPSESVRIGVHDGLQQSPLAAPQGQRPRLLMLTADRTHYLRLD